MTHIYMAMLNFCIYADYVTLCSFETYSYESTRYIPNYLLYMIFISLN